MQALVDQVSPAKLRPRLCFSLVQMRRFIVSCRTIGTIGTACPREANMEADEQVLHYCELGD